MEDALRLFLAGYLLVLSVSAIWGQHRSLLLYPGRIIYSLVRIVVFGLSFGRVRITPRVRKTVFRGRRMRRSLRRTIDDLREERSEEVPQSWVSARDKSADPDGAETHSDER